MADVAAPTVFISYSDRGSAIELGHLIDRAFEGRVQAFNTASSRSGLSAGDEIDPALLRQVTSAQLFVSIWTPEAVRRPAWMAWELGAASAVGMRVLVARALGVEPRELPLNLSARHAPDLGAIDELMAFFRALSEGLGGASYSETVLRREFERWTTEPSPLHARLVVAPRIRLGLHGHRGLLENLTDHLLTQIEVGMTGNGDADHLAMSITDQLEANLRTLRPKERVVFALPEVSGVDARLQVEWVADDTGRERQLIHVTTPTFPN